MTNNNDISLIRLATRILLLSLLFTPFGHTSLLLGQRPDFNTIGGQQQGPGAFNAQGQPSFIDTVERPPLSVAAYPIADLSNAVEILDTLPEALHLFEPAYLVRHLVPNLGSENSAAQWQPWILSKRGLGFGHNQYDVLLDMLREPYLVEVNRAYGDLSVAEGSNPARPLLSSRHFNTRFFRSFARNIHLNFNYKSYSDEGQGFPRNVRTLESQNNSARYLDLKFFQKSKSGNRISYIQYDNPTINETINRDIYNAFTSIDTIGVNRTERSITLGNRIVSRIDSTDQNRWIWDSRLIFKTESYSALSSPLVKTNTAFLPTELIIEDFLDYRHELSRVILENDWSTDALGGEVKVKVDLESISENFGRDSIPFSRSYFTAVSSGSYQKDLGIFRVSGDINIGLGDASDQRGWGIGLQSSEKKNLSFDFSLSSQAYNAPIDSRIVFFNSRLVREEDRPAISELKLEGALAYKPTRTSFKLETSGTSNLISIGSDGLFTSVAERVVYLKAQIDQSYSLGPFHTSHSFLVQSIDDARFSVPAFSYRGDLHLKGRIFRKNMLYHLGADIHYLSSFDTPEFYALTGLFYNEQENTANGVLLVHPYLNAKVQSFQFFIKGVNALHRLRPLSLVVDSAGNQNVARNLPTVTGSSQYDFRIRFGIKWYFLD